MKPLGRPMYSSLVRKFSQPVSQAASPQPQQELMMADISFPLEHKIQAFKRFVEIGALTLAVEDFSEIIFLTFQDEIEAEIFAISQDFKIPDVWSEIQHLISHSDFDHPLLQQLYRSSLLREIVGPEYSLINRYPRVYDRIYHDLVSAKILNEPTQNKSILNKSIQNEPGHMDDSIQSVSIGLIGSSYGLELITTLRYLFPYFSKIKESSQSSVLKIDVLNKDNRVFRKLKTNSVGYPKSVISKYMKQEEIELYFTGSHLEILSFSDFILEKVNFLDLDLLDRRSLESLSHQSYDLLLFHNVIQYLEPPQGEDLGFLQDFLNLILKMGGTISIINESKLFNRQRVESFHDLYQSGASYSMEMVEQATLYTKIQ
jgi:chemotaxis methyl-accepting protein methylase